MSFVPFRAARVVIGALLLASSAGLAHAESKSILVSLDRAKIMKVPQGVQTMIIGNPLVADVTMLKGNTSMIVTGRSFGSTNLIALDAQGNTIEESLIKVTSGDSSLVVLRGESQESYSCNPRCAPTVALGDDAKYMNDGIGSAKSRNAAAASGGK
ncbi:MAG: pilus assembly protein N-terminal domain-containing protein [Hyphomicrobiales bacterium]|nr:pilus assembly protein N-terminal domain-containing protein [Hyphomicrobiales bacterium]